MSGPSRPTTSAEHLHRAAGMIAVAVGTGAAVSPRLLLRPFGIPSSKVTGTAALGWRMFGIRTALVGGAIVTGDPRARAAMIPVQLADQVTFALAARSADVPVRATRLAQAVSTVLVALSGGAYAQAARERAS